MKTRVTLASAGLTLLALAGCPAPAVPPAGPPTTPPPVEAKPTAPALPPEAVTRVATFRDHHCFVRRAGTVSCWGKNTYGQLGNGARQDSAEPVEVAGLRDATQVVTGRDFSCALRQGGTVACWGNHEDGQLGHGAPARPGALGLAPVEVAGLRQVQQISAGEYHACALDGEKRVSCWGNSADGQVGRTGGRAFSSPAGVGELGDVTQVAAGASHTCALQDDGQVRCWGRHTEGQLGAQVTGSRPVPVRVEGLDGARQLASGHTHSCAVTREGGVVCWGDNRAGQLGSRAAGKRRSKQAIEVAGVTEAEQVGGGGRHACARLRSRKLVCWGDNARGQLGTAASPARPEPVEAPGGADASDLALGAAQTCVVRAAGSLLCWGAVQREISPGPPRVAIRLAQAAGF